MSACQACAPRQNIKDMDRIALLAQVLEQNPTDPFARYGLAMAHLSAGDVESALIEFATLIQHNPDYVPAYQMSAQTLAKEGRAQDALERLHSGIAAANRTGNQHALAEMEALREDLKR
jgi:predicted Zn-dependent protease